MIGPEGNDELVLKSIVAGARAYLDLNADARSRAGGASSGDRRLNLGAAPSALKADRPVAQGFPMHSLTSAART